MRAEMEWEDQETVQLVSAFEKKIAGVLKAVAKNPSGKKRVLSIFISVFFDAIKETLRRQGHVSPLYIILADPIEYGIPPITEEVIARARELGSVAVISVEGFQSKDDIGDVIYHVSMSAPGIGVIGWVLKVRLGDGNTLFESEMPYIFDSREKVKTLGELVYEMENG